MDKAPPLRPVYTKSSLKIRVLKSSGFIIVAVILLLVAIFVFNKKLKEIDEKCKDDNNSDNSDSKCKENKEMYGAAFILSTATSSILGIIGFVLLIAG